MRPATPADVERARECHRAAVRAFGPDSYDERQVEGWLGPGDAEADYPVDDPDHRFVVCVVERSEATDGVSGEGRPASRAAERSEATDEASGARTSPSQANGDGVAVSGGTASSAVERSETTDGGGREVAGFGDLVVPDSEVTAVYVHPDHAGRGVGSALLAHLEGRAREAGLAELTLESSLNAVGFYERARYERVREGSHEMSSGVELPVVVMRKSLATNA